MDPTLKSYPRIASCVALAGALVTVPTLAYAQSSPPSLVLQTAPSQAQRTTVRFHPNRIASTAGIPIGWGQVRWPTAQAAWAWTLGWPAKPSGGLFAHSSDGGKTWVWWYTARTNWYQLACRGSRNAWLSGQKLPSPWAKHPNPPLVWLHTSNGGATWTRWVLRTPPGGSGTAVFPHSGFHAMGQLVDGRFWWSHAGGPWETLWPKADRIADVTSIPGGGEAVALKTASGMTTLRRITVGSTAHVRAGPIESTPAPVTGMDWLTAQDGWIWSESRVWDTTNGGQSWTALGRLPGYPRATPTTLYMTSKTQGYAAAGQTGDGPVWEASQLWTTANGGRTWTRMTLPKITYRLPNVTLPLFGFYVSNVTAHTLTLWYGPITEGGVPQRIWTNNRGETWHRGVNNPPEPH